MTRILRPRAATQALAGLAAASLITVAAAAPPGPTDPETRAWWALTAELSDDALRHLCANAPPDRRRRPRTE